MLEPDKFIEDIFAPGGFPFREKALALFRHQAQHNAVYKTFLAHIGVKADHITQEDQIPFLPIDFFKTHEVKTTHFKEEMIFASSGTTGLSRSKHYIASLQTYERSFLSHFRKIFGEPEQYIIAALLPSYTDRPDSSLIYMVDELIHLSEHPCSDYYSGKADLIRQIESLNLLANTQKRKLLLFGVTHALLKLAEQGNQALDHTIILETGGMKGFHKEITRTELYELLNTKLQPLGIYSEYGMTELLSQAYAGTDGLFYTPSRMKVLIREIQDPFSLCPKMKQGAINIIDLVNVHSCAFIATSDVGRLHEDDGFEVLGRTDHSDMRGCNLLYA